MNDNEWEYILLHNLSREWTGQVTDAETEQEELQTGEGVPAERINEKKTEGEELSGTNGNQITESNGSVQSGETHTSGSGQTSATESRGRSDTGTSGNGPENPDKLQTGDTGKDKYGRWETRKGGRDGQTVTERGFSFQRGKRSRKIEEAK